MRIAFGPISNKPSWRFFGEVLVEELRKWFEIDIIHSKDFWYDEVFADYDIVVSFKRPKALKAILKDTVKRVFIANDYFNSYSQLFAVCQYDYIDCIIVNSYLLAYKLRKFKHIHFIPHHILDYWDGSVEYKEEGFCLWEGGGNANFDHIHSFLTKKTSIPRPNIPFKLVVNKPENIITDLDCVPWTRETMIEHSRMAKVAIDIKGESFKQLTKPSTKVFQYIASGLPVIINSTHSVIPHLKSLGFRPIVATGMKRHYDRWLSREYWEETQQLRKLIIKQFNVRIIAKQYKWLFEKLCQ